MGTDRRGILKGLLGLGAAALGAGRIGKALAATEKEETRIAYATNVFFVAGFQYYQGPALIHDMRLGDSLALVMEPDNPHDSLAVRLEWNGQMIGYVPRTENNVVNALMQQDAPLECHILERSPDAEPWGALVAEVTLMPGKAGRR